MRSGWVLVTHETPQGFGFLLLHDAWRSWPGAFGAMLPSHHGILILEHARTPAIAAGVLDSPARQNIAPQPGERELFRWSPTHGRRRINGSIRDGNQFPP